MRGVEEKKRGIEFKLNFFLHLKVIEGLAREKSLSEFY